MFGAADRLVLGGVWYEYTVSIEKGRKLYTTFFFLLYAALSTLTVLVLYLHTSYHLLRTVHYWSIRRAEYRNPDTLYISLSTKHTINENKVQVCEHTAPKHFYNVI